jgi:biotin carboxyl carrier protein
MKKYRVKVNGKVYEVELEAIEEVKGSIEAPKATAAPVSAKAEGDQEILAPIGGKVLDIKVKVGDKVNKGDTVIIIEAMKLENEVKSAFTGTVKAIKVSSGAMVQNKDVLIVLG